MNNEVLNMLSRSIFTEFMFTLASLSRVQLMPARKFVCIQRMNVVFKLLIRNEKFNVNHNVNKKESLCLVHYSDGPLLFQPKDVKWST